MGCRPDLLSDAPGHTESDSAPPTETFAPLDLCINEFVADNEESWQDETGAFPDWIELHNPSAFEVSLADYQLGDSPDESAWLDPSLSIPAGGFLVLAADGQPELGPTHLPFSLSSEGETVSLFRSDGAAERLSYGLVQTDFSWSRIGDCCADLSECLSAVLGGTPEASNGVP